MVVKVEDLGAPGELLRVDARSASAFSAGHLPGAVWLEVAALSAPRDGVPGQLRPLPELEDALGAAGLTSEDAVVVYAAASDLAAARLFWAFEVIGHARVQFLDGGIDAWTRAGRALEMGEPTSTAADYAGSAGTGQRRVDIRWMLEHLDDPNVVRIDARTPAEYAAGHIPDALNFPWQDNVQGSSLKARDALASLYADLPVDATLVTYCQTGSRASMAYLVLRHLAYADVRLYDGSMAEWVQDAGRPLESE